MIPSLGMQYDIIFIPQNIRIKSIGWFKYAIFDFVEMYISDDIGAIVLSISIFSEMISSISSDISISSFL